MAQIAESFTDLGKHKFGINWDRIIFLLRCFVFSFLISGISFKNKPIGLGAVFVSACGCTGGGILSVIGTVIGYTLFFGFNVSAEYIASSVIIYTILFVFQYTSFSSNKHFTSTISAMVIGIMKSFGAVTAVRTNSIELYSVLVETIASFLITYIYSDVIQFSDVKKYVTFIEFKLLIVYFLMFIPCVHLYVWRNCSIGRIILWLLVLNAMNLPSPLSVIFASFILGAALDYTRVTIFYSIIYMLYSGVLLVYKVHSKSIRCIFFVGINLVAVVYNGAYDLVSYFIEISALCLLYACVPKLFFMRMFMLDGMQILCVEQVKASKDGEKRGLRDLILAVRACLMIDDVDNGVEQTLIEEGVKTVCTRCYKRELCWSNHRSDLQKMFLVTEIICKERGSLKANDFPGWFYEYCPYVGELVKNFNIVLRKNFDLKRMEYELRDKVSISCDILGALSDAVYDWYESEFKETNQCCKIRSAVYEFLGDFEKYCTVLVSENQAGRFQIEINSSKFFDLINSEKFLDGLSKKLGVRLKLLQNMEESNRVLLMEAEPFAISLGVATKKKNGELCCGDQSTYFKMDTGLFYVILSDGMGSGENAAQQSSLLIHYMEKFIIYGISAENSIKLTQSIFAMKNWDMLNSATLDLLMIDLFTGDCKIYKIGSAPTYVKLKGEIICCSGGYTSVGIDDDHTVSFDVFSFQLDPGSVILMTSDGVLISCIEELEETIRLEGDSMKMLARTVLLQTYNRIKTNDDMSVVAVRMDYRA